MSAPPGRLAHDHADGTSSRRYSEPIQLESLLLLHTSADAVLLLADEPADAALTELIELRLVPNTVVGGSQ